MNQKDYRKFYMKRYYQENKEHLKDYSRKHTGKKQKAKARANKKFREEWNKLLKHCKAVEKSAEQVPGYSVMSFEDKAYTLECEDHRLRKQEEQS